MVKNFISVVSNPALFSPTVYLVPEIVKYDEKRTILHVHIPPSAEVHSYKKVIYDRVDDADVKVTATGAIAQMYIRKQNIFTEKKIYPYAKLSDLRLDLLPKIRLMARNNAPNGTYSWTAMDDEELLLDFARKHLPDKFFLEASVRKSLRNTIAREMVSNTLMHWEFTSSYTAKFVIEKNQMYVENASRASKEGYITMDNLEPNPKNPIIASFFRNIGYADQLGSGVRNLFKYTRLYSGKDPEFKEGDIFRIIVPLDDAYSFDFGTTADKLPINSDKVMGRATKNATDSATKDATDKTKAELSEDEKKILALIKAEPQIMQKKLQQSPPYTGVTPDCTRLYVLTNVTNTHFQAAC